MATDNQARLGRKQRIRRKLTGTAEKPRLTVYKSLKHIYAQVIDDASGKTIASVTSNSKEFKGASADLDKSGMSKKIGEAIAKACLAKNVNQVVFDRNGFPYHGRIAAVADAAREAGLKF